MRDYFFRIEIDNVLRKILSKGLDVLSYERGPDFRTRDFKYIIEMKSRRINKDNEKNHFSLKPRQYYRFIELSEQSFFQPKEEVPISSPHLLFLLLKYKTKVPVFEIPEKDEIEKAIRRNLIITPGSYLVDYGILRRFDSSNKWMSVKTADLDQITDEFGIEPVVVKKLKLPIFPIGKNSKHLAKEWGK